MNFWHSSRKKNILEADEVFVDSASILDSADHLERKIERPLGRAASLIFLVLVCIGIGYLASRAFMLQARSGNDFFVKSEENRFSIRPIFSPRGVVYDHFGVALVENTPSFGLVWDRAAFQKEGGIDPTALMKEFEAVIKNPSPSISEISENLAAAGNSTSSERMILARDITAEAVVAIAAHLDTLPGVQIFESYQRRYRDSYALSHVLGFVGKISPEDLIAHPELADEETVGKSGIEAIYDDFLRGRGGKKIVEVDSRGIASRYKFTQEPQPGSALTLTIDGALQEAVYNVVRGYTAGARAASVVAVDPRTGAIRALVSFPGYDASRFGHSLSAEEFSAVLRDPLRPLFNRAISGEFPSGSTIKPLLAAAALEEKIIDPAKKIYDEGFIAIPNPYHPGERSIFLDWKKHGWVDLYDAIAKSANVYFYMIGGGWRDQEGLGIARIKKYETAFGLGSLSGIDLPGERAGLVPDPEWKKTASPRDPIWRIGDTYNTSIGQGGTKVTPLQLAMAVSAIANGGILWKPYLLERVRDPEGAIVEERDPMARRADVVGENNLAVVRRAMRQTVTSGTARLLASVPVDVAAKTGTAQSPPGLPHAWVSAFAPADNPEIAIVVMVEHAGEGATVAVPITNEILQWYFLHRPPHEN